MCWPMSSAPQPVLSLFGESSACLNSRHCSAGCVERYLDVDRGARPFSGLPQPPPQPAWLSSCAPLSCPALVCGNRVVASVPMGPLKCERRTWLGPCPKHAGWLILAGLCRAAQPGPTSKLHRPRPLILHKDYEVPHSPQRLRTRSQRPSTSGWTIRSSRK